MYKFYFILHKNSANRTQSIFGLTHTYIENNQMKLSSWWSSPIPEKEVAAVLGEMAVDEVESESAEVPEDTEQGHESSCREPEVQREDFS